MYYLCIFDFSTKSIRPVDVDSNYERIYPHVEMIDQICYHYNYSAAR